MTRAVKRWTLELKKQFSVSRSTKTCCIVTTGSIVPKGSKFEPLGGDLGGPVLCHLRKAYFTGSFLLVSAAQWKCIIIALYVSVMVFYAFQSAHTSRIHHTHTALFLVVARAYQKRGSAIFCQRARLVHVCVIPTPRKCTAKVHVPNCWNKLKQHSSVLRPRKKGRKKLLHVCMSARGWFTHAHTKKIGPHSDA